MIKIINYNLKLKIYKDSFYRREKDDTAIVHGIGRVCYLSRITADIYELLPVASYTEIVNKLMAKYDDINLKSIMEKMINSLCFLENNGIILIEEEWLQLKDGNCIIGEEEFKFLSQFCKSKLENTDNESACLFPSMNLSYYELRRLRSTCFDAYETVFATIANSKIINAIFIGNIRNATKVYTLDGLIFDDESIFTTFEYCKMKLKEIGCKKLKYTTTLPNEKRLILLSELGFKYETKLSKEVDNKDLLIYSLFL